MTKTLVAGAAIVALALAGCGGGGTHYTKAASSICLEQLGAPSTGDFIGDTATGGSVAFDQSDHRVVVSFGNDQGEAQTLAQSYSAIITAYGSSASDYVATRGNAVAVWDVKPTVEQKNFVLDCLSAGRSNN